MTQEQKVTNLVAGKQLSIQDIAAKLEIKEPNVRRILGQGVKTGKFERVTRGIYTIKTSTGTKAVIKVCDALDEIKNLRNTGIKFDTVFLDIPYKTAAVVGGSRGVKYSLITPDQFAGFLEDLKPLLATPDTHIYYMYSNAPSGMKDMQKYNTKLEQSGFKRIALGSWQKLFKNGKLATNMRGNVMPPEGLALYNLSGKHNLDYVMNFTLAKTNTASEKPLEMLKQLVKQSSSEGQTCFDPFAGTGSFGEACLKLSRNVYLFEKSEERVQKEILPRLQFI